MTTNNRKDNTMKIRAAVIKVREQNKPIMVLRNIEGTGWIDSRGNEYFSGDIWNIEFIISFDTSNDNFTSLQITNG